MRDAVRIACFLIVGCLCLAAASRLCFRPLSRGVGLEMFEDSGGVGVRLTNHGPGGVAMATDRHELLFGAYPGESDSYLMTILRTDVDGGSPSRRVVLRPGESREFPGIVNAGQLRALPGREFSLRVRYDDPGADSSPGRFRGAVTSAPKRFRRAPSGAR